MLTLILGLALTGFLTYLVTTYIPMPDIFKKLIVVVVVIALIVFLLQLFGLANMPVPRLR